MSMARADNATKSYAFVDGVRFWSMFAVIAMHAMAVFLIVDRPAPHMTQMMEMPFKFGTIAFFLISGFLLGDKLRTCDARAYLKRRLRRVFAPWTFWFLLFLVSLTIGQLVHDPINVRSWSADVVVMRWEVFRCLFETPFWFVPNLMLGICVLLTCRRYLYDVRLGAVLLVFNLMYVVNLYVRWYDVIHTEALLGFVFYLWLGSYAAHHWDRLRVWIAGVSMGWLAGGAVLAGFAAYAESEWLLHTFKSGDSLDTLRLWNQVFSVMVVLVLVKVRGRTWPGWMHPRRETFGIYLSHAMVLDIVMHGVRAWFRPRQGSWLLAHHAGLLVVWAGTLAATYGICLMVTRALAAWRRTGWLVGVVEEGVGVRREVSGLLVGGD
jgi:peptidoglycan/LPS O-acetylase OafA/YrhL